MRVLAPTFAIISIKDLCIEFHTRCPSPLNKAQPQHPLRQETDTMFLFIQLIKRKWCNVTTIWHHDTERRGNMAALVYTCYEMIRSGLYQIMDVWISNIICVALCFHSIYNLAARFLFMDCLFLSITCYMNIYVASSLRDDQNDVHHLTGKHTNVHLKSI